MDIAVKLPSLGHTPLHPWKYCNSQNRNENLGGKGGGIVSSLNWSLFSKPLILSVRAGTLTFERGRAALTNL